MAGVTRRPLVAGNWKMHGLRSSAAEFAENRGWRRQAWPPRRTADLPAGDTAGCLRRRRQGFDQSRSVAKTVMPSRAGAFTGDIAAEMLADSGASAVIVGHSERRTHHGETDAQVRAKALAAWRAKLVAIVCIGETRQEREAGRTLDVLARQLDGSLPDGATPANLVVAYEPVWAIGTGLTPTVADVAQAHGFIRQRLGERFGTAAEAIRILYGGSVKASNAAELMAAANVDGALVGGASLKAEEFLAIGGVYR